MSVCISKHGEYSAHTPSEDDEFTCGSCFVLDEQAIRDRLATAERREREAAAQALREAADAADSVGHYWSGDTAHAAFGLANAYRDHADRVERGEP